MRLVYYKGQNVGDALNAWLWPRLGVRFSDDPEHICLGIGSILANGFIGDRVRKVTVLGSGARSRRTLPARAGREWDIRFVRGPGTAALTGAPYISDPAILMPRVLPASGPRQGVGFVPHFLSSDQAVQEMWRRSGANVISPALEPEAFVRELAGCERVVCEAMHGAILADAYRIPWAPVRLETDMMEGRTNRFKWRDWVQSLGIPARMPRFPVWGYAPRQIRQTIGGMRRTRSGRLHFTLSDETALSAAQDRILEALQPLT